MIRRTNPSDIDYIVKIDQTSLSAHWSKVQYFEEMERDDTLFFVVELNQVPVGFILVRIFEEISELYQIAIDASYRRQGFASQLLEAVIHELPKGTQLFLEVASKNLEARTFYSKHNFKEIRTRKHYYNDGDDAIELRKVI